VTDEAVLFSIADARYRRVALAHDLRQPRLVPFTKRGRRWELRFQRPEIDRLEYLLELEHRDGRVERVPDPGTPLRAPGPFGDKSVVEFPGYEPPYWVDDDTSPQGALRELTLGSRVLRTSIDALLWSAVDTDPAEPLPLLLVHDGPEMARFSELLRLLDHLVAFGEVPPLRAALLPPPLDRNETYSASARYAQALVRELVPALCDAAPFARPPVGLGASMGALSLLHAHWTHPELFGGLFLQSGSFFRRSLDAHETSFGRFARVARFVSTVVGGRSGMPPVPVTFTCGTAEENHGNNRLIAAALQRQGWDARVVEHRDAHNWISWRDVLHPHLAELVLRARA
jgi:enterochelin esterase-like enzyme